MGRTRMRLDEVHSVTGLSDEGNLIYKELESSEDEVAPEETLQAVTVLCP